MNNISTRCCIAGGGPAGIMLGFLMARAGVDTVVLEKHADFLRDFRGDTVHPSTLQIMDELGLLDDFLSRPHQKVSHLTGYAGNTAIPIADFSHLPSKYAFVALMPQWEFLNFMVEHAKQYPTFKLLMQTEGTELIFNQDRVVGLKALSDHGPLDIRAEVVIAADGRHSQLRDQSKLPLKDLGAPMDILWMRLPRHKSDPENVVGRFVKGRVFVMLNRGDYWQCAYVIPKGGYDIIRAEGLGALKAHIVATEPLMANRVDSMQSWDEVKLLVVSVNRLETWWRPGLLIIGDAAHAMSPVGGVGINLAIQDAVAAANILAPKLKMDALEDEDLAEVQARRQFPTMLTQRLQLIIQNNIIGKVLANKEEIAAPKFARMMTRFPILQRIPARTLGLGFRPEHIHTNDVFSML